MRALIQKVTEAQVSIDGIVKGKIGKGLLVFIGITHSDTPTDLDKLVKKTIGLRIFNDSAHKMNLSLKDIDGEILLISQFTLYGNSKKGNRPSFIEAAPPIIAEPLYKACIKALESQLGKGIATGQFGADMQVNLTNDGPVTIWYDTKQ